MTENRMWTIRAGKGASMIDIFRTRNIVAVGWEVGDLTKVSSTDEVKDKVSAIYTGKSSLQQSMIASEISRFKFDVAIGDYVITSDTKNSSFLLGVIKSEYEYDQNNSQNHIRKVGWVTTVSKDKLTPKTRNRIGAISTIFNISGRAKEELLAFYGGAFESPNLQTNIADILKNFESFVQTEEGKEAKETTEEEIGEVRKLLASLFKMDRKSDEFTIKVLYDLLPHCENKISQRESCFSWFGDAKFYLRRKFSYSDSDFNNIANLILNLCLAVQNDPDNIERHIANFTSSKYSRGLQCCAISPILFCINNKFTPIASYTNTAFETLTNLFGKRDKLSKYLSKYNENMGKIEGFKRRLESNLIRNNLELDLFLYWYDGYILSDYQDEDEEAVVDDDEDETDSDSNYKQLVANYELAKDREFSIYTLKELQRAKIRHIIDDCQRTKWVLPHFQRYYDWTKTDVRELWESIVKDYYIGSFLLWETDSTPEVGIQPIEGVKPTDDLRQSAIILDGQQRITSLYYSTVFPNQKHFDEENFYLRKSRSPQYFYIDFYTLLTASDDTQSCIKVLTRKLTIEDSVKRLWFPLFMLDKSHEWIDKLEDALIAEKTGEEQKRTIRKKIEVKLRHIWDGYEIPYITLPEKLKLEQVTDIFEKINTKGKQLDVFDLLIARFYIFKINLKDIW
ncbi:MAG: DUF262 domain-containing protein, partial [Planctomycetes bacterium]|nr:DUF262 domain-containing protein [Planctomycetota bacterium]